jgi:hypothetical protein
LVKWKEAVAVKFPEEHLSAQTLLQQQTGSTFGETDASGVQRCIAEARSGQVA